MPDPEHFSKVSQYDGFQKTAPVVKNFLESFGCQSDGKGLWGENRQTSFWFLFPGAVPLFTEERNHVTDFGYYWKWLMQFKEAWPVQTRSNIKFTMGTYQTTASFAPRGYKFRRNTPWQRLNRYYAKPRMTGGQPKLFSTVKSLLTYLPRYSACENENWIKWGQNRR